MGGTVFIAYNRPELVKETIKPLIDCPNLYLFKDGEKKGGAGAEISKGDQILEIFEEIKKKRKKKKTTIFVPTENLGPRDGPITAITWMLKEEGEGTIIEEDVLIHQTFLPFYELQLKLHRENPSIFALSSGVKNSWGIIHPHSTQLSKLLLVWGWATWWEKFSKVEIPNQLWKTSKDKINKNLSSLTAKLYFQRELSMLDKNPNYCWSYYLQMHILTKELYTIIPKTKLTKNLGIGMRNLRTKKGEDTAIKELEALSLLKEYEKLKNEILGKYNKKTEAKLEKKKCGNVLTEIRNRVKLRERLRKVVTGQF